MSANATVWLIDVIWTTMELVAQSEKICHTLGC